MKMHMITWPRELPSPQTAGYGSGDYNDEGDKDDDYNDDDDDDGDD